MYVFTYQLVSMEVCMMIIINWHQQWYDFFPNAPVNVLNMIEICIAHVDATLVHHLASHHVTSHVCMLLLMMMMLLMLQHTTSPHMYVCCCCCC